MKNNDRLSFIVDFLGLSFIGSFCLAYSLFYKNFAKLYLYFKMLDFPIFMGEVLLFICALLFFIKVLLKPVKLKKTGYILILYLLFVFFKAITGYYEFGPLAFRHAAIFYYPLFAIFIYYFFSRIFFNDKLSLFLVLVIIFFFKLFPPHEYYFFTFFVLSVILIKIQSRKSIKYILFFLLLLVFPFKSLFLGIRMMLIGNVVAILFLAAMILKWIKVKKYYKFFFTAIFLLIFAFTLFKNVDRNAILSLINPKKIIAIYQEYNKVVADKEGSY